MTWDTQSRPQKDEVRTYALEGLKHKDRTLWLPAETCYCIQRALSLGVIDASTHIICVERCRQIMPSLTSTIHKWQWQHAPQLILGELAQVQLPFDLDYAFLDFTGTFELATVWWMCQELANKWSTGADLCVTHAYGWRNNGFMYNFANKIKRLERYKELKREIWIDNDQVAVPMAILGCVFNRFDFHTIWPVKYQDSVQSMLLFRMENFVPLSAGKTNGWPAFADMLSPKELKAMTTAAAKKAWKTRNAKPVSAGEVIEALVTGRRNRNELFDRYVKQRVADGYKETNVRAAIKAHVTRQTA